MKTREGHANNRPRPRNIVRMVCAFHITVSVLNYALDGLASLHPGAVNAISMRIHEIFLEIVDGCHRRAAHVFAQQIFHSGLIHPFFGVHQPSSFMHLPRGPSQWWLIVLECVRAYLFAEST